MTCGVGRGGGQLAQSSPEWISSSCLASRTRRTASPSQTLPRTPLAEEREHAPTWSCSCSENNRGGEVARMAIKTEKSKSDQDDGKVEDQGPPKKLNFTRRDRCKYTGKG
jgi:hypothetical protein